VALAIVGIALFLVDRGDERAGGHVGTEATAPATTAGPGATSAPGDGDSAAVDVLATLRVEGESDGGYERAAFGDGWAPAGDGCDVREEVLAVESTIGVARADDGCEVTQGRWVSLYDGYSTADPGELEIDHLVPLAEAWASGARAWPEARRVAYANDTRHPDALIAVTAATNTAKRDRDPAEWMPPARDAWCRYASAWVTQKHAWRLTVDAAEKRALTNVLATC
jgi:hypothetical protein